MAGGVGFGSAPGGAAGVAEVTIERLEARHEEELQRMRGEVARLRMSNELMSREMSKLKSVVGAALPGEYGGIDVDSLASRKEVEALKAELAKLKRQHSQERDSDQGALHAEVDSLRRAMHSLSMRVNDMQGGGGGRP
jgi:chromosome segregation ATPase